jgi:hypothetical protein
VIHPADLGFDVADARRNAGAKDRRIGEILVVPDHAVALMNGRDHAPIERRGAWSNLLHYFVAP